MTQETTVEIGEKKQSFSLTLLILATLTAVGILQVVVWDNYERLPVAMAFIILLTGLVAWTLGYTYKDVETGIDRGGAKI